jgi:hypothetical protein
MSVTVKHLNADSTFLLIFSPEANPRPSDLTSTGGAFLVLIDPWLNGPSIVTAPWFARTDRRIPSAIQHLSEIEEPDVVVVSQKKPDHCHKETLLQLHPEGKTVIAAEPGAAKTIKSWNHFDPAKVHGLLKYDSKHRFGRSLRLPIPALSVHGHPGELNISFIPAKNYVTGLHNAFGITYQPPTRTKTVAAIATVDLPKSTKYFHMPLTPMTLPPLSPTQSMSPLSPRPMSFDLPSRDNDPTGEEAEHQVKAQRAPWSRASKISSSEFLLPWSEEPIVLADAEHDTGDIVQRLLTIPDRSSGLDIPFHFQLDPSSFKTAHTLPTPPYSPTPTLATSTVPPSPVSTPMTPNSAIFHRRVSFIPSHQKSLSSMSTTPNLSLITPARPKAISVIYSPHGLPLSDLQPYVQNHLVRLTGALPLTLLFHSFDRAQNPWFLGGNIMTGMEGGAEIARALMARCWISAHDEVKDDRGLSVKKLRVQRTSADEVRKHLWDGEHGEWLRKKGWMCDVRSLKPGKEMLIGPTRDLCSGMEGKRESRLLRFGIEDSKWTG